MDTLVFAPMYFYCFKGNVGNMAVMSKRSNHQRDNICHLFPYIMLFQQIIKYKNSSWGRGSTFFAKTKYGRIFHCNISGVSQNWPCVRASTLSDTAFIEWMDHSLSKVLCCVIQERLINIHLFLHKYL